MKTGKKIFLIICMAFLVCAVALAGTVFYYYTHPSSIKNLVETSLSRAMGCSVAIGSLSYAIHPMRIHLKEIALEPGPDMRGLYIDIPDLYGEFLLDGPFGRRSLIARRLEARGLSCRMLEDASYARPEKKVQTPSLIVSLLKRGFAIVVFREFKLDGATLTDGTALVRQNDQTLRLDAIQGRLNADRQVEISCGARFEWPSRKIHLVAPLLRIQTERAISLVHTEIGASVTCDHILLESPVADLEKIRATLRVVYRSDQRDVIFEDMDLTVQKAVIHEIDHEVPVRLDLRLRGDGVFSLKDHRLRITPLHLDMDTRFRLAGELEGAAGTGKTMELKVSDCRVMPQELVSFFPLELQKKTERLTVGGPIDLSGRIGGVEGSDGWTWDANLDVRLKQNRISFTDRSVTMSGMFTGLIETRGWVPDMEISADLDADRLVCRGFGIDMEPSETAVSFSGRLSALDLKNLSARIPGMTARFQNKTIRLEDISLRVTRGRVNGVTGAVALSDIRFDASLLKNITASIEAAPGRLEGLEIRGNETGLAEWAMSLRLLPPGWKLAGQDAFRVQVRLNGEGGMAVDSELALKGVTFQGPNAACAGENLSIKATIEGKITPSTQGITADISLNGNGGEALYDRFYVDLKKTPFFSHGSGAYRMQDREFTWSNLELGLKDLLTCRLDGRLSQSGHVWRTDLTANIPLTPLEPLFGFFVVEPFRTEQPLVGAIRVGGTVSADVNLKGTLSDWAARGSVAWNHGGVLSEAKGIALKGIDLALPLWICSGDGEDAAGELKGNLSITSAVLPFIPEQALAFPLEIGPNRLSIPSSTVVKIPGGDLRVGPVAITGRRGGAPSLHTDLSMNRVDMKPLLAPVWSGPIDGSLSGTLNPVRLEGGKLESNGTLTATVFHGEVLLSDLGVSGLWTGTPVVRLDAQWKDLALSELTADTSFGKIEGVLNGYAKDLEIARGQVQKFDLLAETVRKEGIAQRISVKAVDNIARIGGGQSPFVGMAGMFASIFKEFPYETMGVHATLENDIFRINGTLREGDTEYLVKRGLLSGVNVVNQNPDHRVSFKDMIQRIKRIKTSKGGPVIE